MLLTILAQTTSVSTSPTTPAKPTNALVSLLPLILIFGLFYLFMIRPQRQRQRKQAELMGDLQIGDEVQTAAGMFGKIVQLSDEFEARGDPQGWRDRGSRAGHGRVTRGTKHDVWLLPSRPSTTGPSSSPRS